MAATCALVGTIAPRSQPAAMRVRGVVVAPTRTPIVSLVPCRHCGKFYGCDCLDWLDWMLMTTPQEESTDE